MTINRKTLQCMFPTVMNKQKYSTKNQISTFHLGDTICLDDLTLIFLCFFWVAECDLVRVS
jgi:hypothetical protein